MLIIFRTAKVSPRKGFQLNFTLILRAVGHRMETMNH